MEWSSDDWWQREFYNKSLSFPKTHPYTQNKWVREFQAISECAVSKIKENLSSLQLLNMTVLFYYIVKYQS